VTNLAGQAYVSGTANGQGTNALFSYPVGIAADSAGNLYVADSQNNAIRMINTNNYVTNVAVGGYVFDLPNAVAVDGNNNIWVTDSGHQVICMISNGVATAVAGTFGHAGTNDSATSSGAQFNSPSGLLWDSAHGYLLISDTGNDTVRSLFQTNIDGSLSYAVQTIAGIARQPGLGNGAFSMAQFNTPIGLSVDPRDHGFYIADSANNVVRVLLSTQPVAVTDPASGIAATNATLNGTVNAENEPVSYYFEWGTSTNYGNDTPTTQLTNNLAGAQAVSAVLGYLEPGTTYHFQLVAFNSLGSSAGGDLTLATPSQPPVVATLLASNVTTSSATLLASVNPEYSPTMVFFE
jgi:hypothetical protein